MGMSTHVVGLRQPDEKWHQMKAVYDACTAAKVTVPDEVEAFFLGEPLDDGGIVVDLSEDEAVKAWNTESASGYEVDVKDLPDSIEVVRFYNSW